MKSRRSVRSAALGAYRAARAKADEAAVRASLPFVRMVLGERLQPKEELVRPPAFIIGLPRCGSTFLYQALTNFFDVAYIDNLACRWSCDLRVGMELSRQAYGGMPHGTFESQLGVTRGGHAPSECGRLWYRWLPRDDHFISGNVDQHIADGIRTEIVSASQAQGKPFLFKNLHMGQRIRLLHQVFPEARFVRLVRSHVEIVSSMLEARSTRKIPRGRMWSTRPARWRQLQSLSELDMVAAQVIALERQIEQDLTLFPPSQTTTLRFPESLFDDAKIHAVGALIGAGQRHGGELPRPRRTVARRRRGVSDAEIVAALDRAILSPLTIPVPLVRSGCSS